MKLKVPAWVGLIFVAVGVVISFYISWRLIHPIPQRLPTFGVEALYVYVGLLDIIGVFLILLGGFIRKPMYFWLACFILGLLHIISLWGFIIKERSWVFGQTLTLLILPGAILIFEGIILRVLEIPQRKK